MPTSRKTVYNTIAEYESSSMRSKDIYVLLEKGFPISNPSVCKYIASIAKQKEDLKSGEAFVRGDYPPGESWESGWRENELNKNVNGLIYIQKGKLHISF